MIKDSGRSCYEWPYFFHMFRWIYCGNEWTRIFVRSHDKWQVLLGVTTLSKSSREVVNRNGNRFHRLHHEILHNLKKNLDQNGSLEKKVRAFLNMLPKFLRSKIFENFHWKLYENENFWDRKFTEFFSSKKFQLNFQWKFSMTIFENFRSQNFREHI